MKIIENKEKEVLERNELEKRLKDKEKKEKEIIEESKRAENNSKNA